MDDLINHYNALDQLTAKAYAILDNIQERDSNRLDEIQRRKGMI